MATEYEPMQQVRKDFRVSWYRCPIDRNKVRELTLRSDLKGAFQTLGHMAFGVITGLATYYFFNQRMWIGFALALFAHGTIYSFYAGIAVHELAHGTVFKTKWLNGLFMRVFCIISWYNFHDYKMSHTYHHLYTLHPRGDREVVLPTNPTLNILFVLQLFTLNAVGARNEPYGYPMVQNIGRIVRLALIGRHKLEWLQAVYADQEEVLRKSANWARLILLFNVTLIVVSVVFRLWMLPVLVTFAPFLANWLRYFVAVPMHTGLRDNVADFRLCVRSITLDPFSSFIYWRMNWHTEHHMFAAVPSYNLKRLHEAVAEDMPQPRSLVGAWQEMRQIRKRQKQDPSYQFDTPLPAGKHEERQQDDLERSIGDLDSRTGV